MPRPDVFDGKDTAEVAATKFNYDSKNGNSQSSIYNDETDLDKFVRNNISGPLGEQVGNLTDFIAKHPLVGFLDSTIGKVFGGHPGQTYWESKAPPKGSAARVQYEIDNPRPVTDQFTYQRTAAQVANGVDADALRGKVLSYSGNDNSYDANNTVVNPDGTVRTKGGYTNTGSQRASNSTNSYANNYFKAIPDSTFATANPIRTAQNDPFNRSTINKLYNSVLGRDVGQAGMDYYLPMLNNGTLNPQGLSNILNNSEEKKNVTGPLSSPSNIITSPSASNSVAISYGNNRNGGRQWTSGVFANNNGSRYTNDASAPLDPATNPPSLNDLYQEVFGRNVGQSGIDAYQSALDNKTMTPEQLRAILMASDEKTNQVETGNTATVVTAPLDVNDSVSLSPDTSTTNTASSSGTGPDFRYTVEDGSVFSYDPSTGTPTLVTGPLGTSSAVLSDEDQLREYYKTYLGREIGNAGLTGYTNMLADGSKSMSDIKADLAWVNKQGGESAITSQAAATGAA